MPGPPPKDPKTRARRNKESTEAHLDDENPIAEFEIPDLPDFGDPNDDWRQETRDVWAEIWASPMAREYIRADVHRIVIYARLYDKVARGNLSMLGELRLQGACLGLTPIDRRRLGWVVSKAAAPKKAAKPPTRNKSKSDPRGVLRAVPS